MKNFRDVLQLQICPKKLMQKIKRLHTWECQDGNWRQGLNTSIVHRKKLQTQWLVSQLSFHTMFSILSKWNSTSFQLTMTLNIYHFQVKKSPSSVKWFMWYNNISIPFLWFSPHLPISPTKVMWDILQALANEWAWLKAQAILLSLEDFDF